MSLFVKYFPIDWTRAVRNLKHNVMNLTGKQEQLDCFELLLNLNLTKVLKPTVYLTMAFDLFKSTQLGSTQESRLSYPEFCKSEKHILDSANLYKLRLLDVSRQLCDLKPYTEGEYREVTLVPLKLIQDFQKTTSEHFDKIVEWFSVVDRVVLLKILSLLVINHSGKISLGCLNLMRKALKASNLVEHDRNEAKPVLTVICQKLRGLTSLNRLQEFRLKILEEDTPGRLAASSIYELVDETMNPTTESFEELGKRLTESSNSLQDNVDKIIPLMFYEMRTSSGEAKLTGIVQDLRKKVLKFASA